jgi:rhamnosyltransferase
MRVGKQNSHQKLNSDIDFDLRKVYAVVIGYQPTKKIIKNVELLLLEGVNVIFVDNGSNTESLVYIRKIEENPQVFVLYNEKNLGIATALNQGVEYARTLGGTWVFTFDQDSQIVPGFALSMLNAFVRSEVTFGQVAVLAPQYQDQISHRLMGFGPFDANGLGIRRSIITSGNLFRNSVFDRIGKFDDDYFIDYVDIDITLRARKLGFSVIQTEDALLYHNLGDETRVKFLWKNPVVSNHNFRRRYTITRNRIYTYQRYMIFDMYWFFDEMRLVATEFIKMCMYEKNRRKKLRSVFLGIRDAFFRVTGPYQYD